MSQTTNAKGTFIKFGRLHIEDKGLTNPDITIYHEDREWLKHKFPTGRRYQIVTHIKERVNNGSQSGGSTTSR